MEKSELIKEFQRCKDDPVYFISNYVRVTHPVRGLVPFKLYPFQVDILEALKTHRFNVLRKFRQAGCTTISAAYSLWMITFQKHKQVVILSKGDAESTEVLDRIKIMYEELPAFLRPKIVEDNKHTLKLSTGSTIKSRPSGKQSGRSLAGSLLIIDEAAFIENIDTIWAAVYPIISTGGRAFVLSGFTMYTMGLKIKLILLTALILSGLNTLSIKGMRGLRIFIKKWLRKVLMWMIGNLRLELICLSNNGCRSMKASF